MGAPSVIPPGGGEVIGDSPDRRVEILFEHEALHATWSRFGPHRDGAELRYLNFHAPGVGFADYMRAMRDGRTPTFDQDDPPADGVRPPAEAEIVEPSPRTDRVTLLTEVDEIVIAEVWADLADPSAAPRVDPRPVNSLYVLDGELAIAADDRGLRAAAGSWVQLPPDVTHTLACAGQDRVRYLEVRAPRAGSP